MEKDKTHLLLHGNLTRVFLKYVIPGILSSLVTLLFGVFDTMFIGQNIGALGVAGLNLALPVFSLQMAPGLILGIGGATLGAIAAGKGDPEEQDRCFTLVLLLAAAVSLLEAVFGSIYVRQIAAFFGAKGRTLELTVNYLRPILIASPAFVLNPALSAFIRNDNNPRLAMFSVVGCSLLNILLDWLAVEKLRWGMLGAASATAVSMTIGTLILLTHFTGKKNTLRLAKLGGAVRRLLRVLACGLPAFILELANGLSIFLYNNRLLHYAGDKGVAAYAVCAVCVWLSTTFVAGIGNGVQPILSTNFGAGQLKRVRRVRDMALFSAVFLSVLILLFCQTSAEAIVRFFVDADDELLALATRAVHIYTFSLPFLALGIVLASYLQAMNFSLYSTAVQLSRGVVLCGIFVFLLPVFFDTDGIWAAPIASELLTAVLALFLAWRAAPRIRALTADPGALPEE